MALPDILKKLLESGVHFGHLSKHWNPKMKRFIFGKKKNIYIIDLEKTVEKLQEAKDFVKEKAQAGEKILFVATKKQLREMIKEFASSCSMPYVTERWVGGLLTNFSTVRSRVNRYLGLLDRRERGKFDKMVKKEVVKLNREIERMERNYSGVTTLETLPQCVFVVDPKKEESCVREAIKLSIPIVALIDTDADPDIIDYPIPGNDDSIKSVKSIISYVVEAINEGLEKLEESAEAVSDSDESKDSEAKSKKIKEKAESVDGTIEKKAENKSKTEKGKA